MQILRALGPFDIISNISRSKRGSGARERIVGAIEQSGIYLLRVGDVGGSHCAVEIGR